MLRPAARDEGFTLVELLVSVIIMAVIAAPLAGVIIGYIRDTGAATGRLSLSHDAQISAAYFARDVAATGVRDYTAGAASFQQSIQLGATYDAGGQTCGTAATPAAAVRFLGDDWDTSGATPADHVSVTAYYLAGPQLHRIKCTGGSAVPVSDLVLAHYVKPGTVAVTCSTACEAAAVPERVTLSFTVTAASDGDYPLTLTGQRRQT